MHPSRGVNVKVVRPEPKQALVTVAIATRVITNHPDHGALIVANDLSGRNSVVTIRIVLVQEPTILVGRDGGGGAALTGSVTVSCGLARAAIDRTMNEAISGMLCSSKSLIS